MSIETTATARPRQWMFLDKESGDPFTFTCMPGCVIRHDILDECQKRAPAEILCWTSPDRPAYLPVECASTPEDVHVLAAQIQVRPFATSMAARLPHVTLEIVEDHTISGLDPDSLAAVIGVLAERLEALRGTHADLVRLRAEYLGRPAAPEQAATAVQQPAVADGPDASTVNRAWDAIEDVFKASANPEMTRNALREFVDLTAAKAAPEVTA
ncbi:DUF6907 domain-containing protein [Streptomyces antibioticus]|uniref:DUF6907 domain-containing protein n=1 Tax=Streptomyces antibioticus TaxID=1890 RepID=UPI003D750EAF